MVTQLVVLVLRAASNPRILKKQLLNYARQKGWNLEDYRYSDYTLALWNGNQPLHAQNALITGEAAGFSIRSSVRVSVRQF
jgi:hypothetical protein